MQLQEWVEQSLGPQHPIARDASASHGIAQRLDRQTSGSLLWGSTYSGYLALRLQLASRRVRKVYICLCHGRLSTVPSLLQTLLLVEARRNNNEPPRSIAGASRGLPARTEILVVGHLMGPGGDEMSLVEVRIHTGLMHQIRSHLSSIGHPLAGDTTYGGGSPQWCPRMFLHAWRLGVDIGDGPIDAEVSIPKDLRRALQCLVPVDEFSRAFLARWPCH